MAGMYTCEWGDYIMSGGRRQREQGVITPGVASRLANQRFSRNQKKHWMRSLPETRWFTCL